MPDENVMARIKGIRLKKANTLFGRKDALVSICLCLLVVAPVNSLVRELFEDSKADGSSSSPKIFDLLSPEHSSPLKVLHKLLETLDVASTHWRLLQRLGAWNTENQRKAQTLTLRMMAQIWYRLVRFYKCWKWKFGRVFDPRTPESRQAAILEEVTHANICCVGDQVVGAAVANLDSPDELLRPTVKRKFFLTLYNEAKAQTIAIEERFKRVRTSSMANAGNIMHASTITSNHVLGELGSLHSECLQRKGLASPGVRRPRSR